MEEERGGRREDRGPSRFGKEEGAGEMIEEREGRGKKIDSIYCDPTGCSRATLVRLVSGTSQTGDPRVQPVKLLW
jgi:hypothetical protein